MDNLDVLAGVLDPERDASASQLPARLAVVAVTGPTPAPSPASSPDLVEQSSLRAQDVDQLRAEMAADPLGVLGRARDAFDATLSLDELKLIVDQTTRLMEDVDSLPQADATPDSVQRIASAASQDLWLELAGSQALPGKPLPPTFRFDGWREDIAINENNFKFQPDWDWLGWAFNAGPKFLSTGFPKEVVYRSHLGTTSQFTYARTAVKNKPIKVALMADFGTGLYHSRYIASQIERRRPEYVFHLGDVYYAGKQHEFDSYFTPVVAPLLDVSEFWAMPDNHEMLSGARPYFDWIDAKRLAKSKVSQQQEGSYFALRLEPFQIIGIGTSATSDGKYAHGRWSTLDQTEWLESRLVEGRKQGWVNILLTGGEPYDLRGNQGAQLLNDLVMVNATDKNSGGLVDLWFWGNTHYCALFDRGPQSPFIGSCIGHGGYPYGTQKVKPSPAQTFAPLRWLNQRTRFPEFLGVRPDMGSNGFVELTLHPNGSVDMDYVDWMNVRHHSEQLARGSSKDPLAFV
jgi:hypothetical protein